MIKIITGGSGSLTYTGGGFLVQRYLTSGILDSTFGNSGYVTTAFDSINIGISGISYSG